MKVKSDHCRHFVSPEVQRRALQSDGDPWTRLLVSDLGHEFHFQRLDIQDVILPVQSRTSPPEDNLGIETLAYIVSGHPFLWLNGQLHPLNPGDAIGFPSGHALAHTFLNFSERQARLILVKEKTMTKTHRDLSVMPPLQHSGIPTGDPTPWISTSPTPQIIHAMACQVDSPWHYTGSEETFGQGRRLSTPLGLTKLGVWLEILPPGKRSSFPHAHTHEEELAVILEGNPHLWRQGHIEALRSRDAAGFAPGTGIAHCLINNDVHPVTYLMIGEVQEFANEKIHYPLNPVRNMECHRKGTHWLEATALPVGFAPAASNNGRRDWFELSPTEVDDCYRLTRAGHSFGKVTFLGFTTPEDRSERIIRVSLSDASALPPEVRPRLAALLDDFAVRFYGAQPGSWLNSI